jgi:hypothetical protein
VASLAYVERQRQGPVAGFDLVPRVPCCTTWRFSGLCFLGKSFAALHLLQLDEGTSLLFIPLGGLTCVLFHHFRYTALLDSLSESPTIDGNMTLQEEKLAHAEEIDEKDASGTGYTHVEDPVLEKKIVRHLDRRILPWIFSLWLLAFIDRSNVSEAWSYITLHQIPDIAIPRSVMPKSMVSSTTWTSPATSTTSRSRSSTFSTY